MAIFDATKGGPAANAYATIDEADEYFELDYTAQDWAALEDEQKEKLLVTASRQIDWMQAKYNKLDTSQALKFPMTTNQPDIGDGFAQAREASIRQAFYLFQYQEDIEQARTGMIQGVKSESLGQMQRTITGFNPFSFWAPGVLQILSPFVTLEIRGHRA